MNLEEIKAREKAATPGPWHLEEHGMADYLTSSTVMAGDREVAVACDADGIFIAHARRDIPDLYTELDRKSKEALSFHAQATDYYEETVRLKAEVERLKHEVYMEKDCAERFARLFLTEVERVTAIRKAAEELIRVVSKRYPVSPYTSAFYTTGGCEICKARDALAEAIKIPEN